MKSKTGLLALLLFGLLLVASTALTRIQEGADAGLSLISAALFLPLIIWITFKYNEKTLLNFKNWLHNIPTGKGILAFSVLFWYIGLLAIIAYSLYDNPSLTIVSFIIIGFLLGSSMYLGLLKKL